MSPHPLTPAPPQPADGDSRAASGTAAPLPVRARVYPLALLGVVPLTLFVQWSDLRVGGTMAAGPFPPLAACLQWGLLAALNGFVARRQRGRPLLTRAELLIVLAVWLTANMVAGRGLLHPLLASLAGPVYYAHSPAVKEAVARHLPSWLAVMDRAAARHFFEGYDVPVPWSVWRGPLWTWALFFLPFLTANVCLCALFERIWVRQDRLAFPLIELPLGGLHWKERDAGDPGFRLAVCLGVAVPLLLHGFGAANAYVPAIPCIPFFNDLSALLTEPPWDAARPLYLNVYPLLIGATFLAPADVTLSIWFFLLLNKIELVAAAAGGWSDGASGGVVSAAPFLQEQSAGAFLALAAVLAAGAYRPLRRLVGGRPAAEDRALRPLAAGFLLGMGGVLAWCVWTGLPLWFSLGFFGFYLAVALVLSRMMAQGGIPWLLAPILPDRLLLSLTGSAALSPAALTRLMLHVQHLRDTRQMLAPAVFHAGKLRDAVDFPMRRFYGLLLAAVLLALVIGVTSALPIFYRYGALGLAPQSDGVQMSASVIPLTAINQASQRLSNPIGPAPGMLLPIAAGALVTWGLSILRLRFLAWPLHPLGYALTGTLQVGYANKMLFSIFQGWALKTLTLRLGGPHGFRLLRGVALGLILGDLLMGGLLKLLDSFLGPSGYAIF